MQLPIVMPMMMAMVTVLLARMVVMLAAVLVVGITAVVAAPLTIEATMATITTKAPGLLKSCRLLCDLRFQDLEDFSNKGLNPLFGATSHTIGQGW